MAARRASTTSARVKDWEKGNVGLFPNGANDLVAMETDEAMVPRAIFGSVSLQLSPLRIQRQSPALGEDQVRGNVAELDT